ncbi:MFS transporter [Desulfopila sp. IMCC35008]|uniref:MFS transporter n=1 Tax=Desulfopila sp. IMCC35008 TaxID=2653858 RepID=UPI0013D78719|nr:MFS transporter [Desulfopila sp. IMCC35008]
MFPTTGPFAIPNIRLFIAFRIFFNARFYYPVFTILFLDYGLTIEQFALLNSVWAITIVCAEVPSGALADVIGRKRLIITTSVLMLFEIGLIAFVPITNISLVFWAFLLNRILSGLAEALASGADEAIAFDSLKEVGLEEKWPHVLSVQMRLKSIVTIITATTGALVYDPDIINKLLNLTASGIIVEQQQSMRYPIYLTLVLAALATWTSLLFTENPKEQPAVKSNMFHKIVEALRLTLQAGTWIIKTPFALAIIAFGMFHDHILRMIITMTSQYFRLIQLPEASFGLISATLSLLGLTIPKICETLVERNSAAKNLWILFLITVLGLFGLTGFFPYIGLLPMACVYTGLMMISFFTSHYLNQITESSQRATVLSFKGMAFNLAYGIIGVLFALLIQQLRDKNMATHPDWSQQLTEDSSFIAAIGWFPWYTIILFVIILVYFHNRLKSSPEYRQFG